MLCPVGHLRFRLYHFHRCIGESHLCIGSEFENILSEVLFFCYGLGSFASEDLYGLG